MVPEAGPDVPSADASPGVAEIAVSGMRAQNRRTEPYIDPALISESGRTAECIPPIAIFRRSLCPSIGEVALTPDGPS